MLRNQQKSASLAQLDRAVGGSNPPGRAISLLRYNNENGEVAERLKALPC
ncbi:hypothetical protein VDIAB_250312 [Vibrio diabolicus]|nr:hypothetical protein VDIAB_250312 [Vibrio diabolicus]